MGNSLRCCLACVLPCGALDLIRIVHLNGTVEEITRPTTAAEILKANPNHVLSKPSSQGVVRKIMIVSPDSELKRGSIYFLIPYSSVPEKKKNIVGGVKYDKTSKKGKRCAIVVEDQTPYSERFLSDGGVVNPDKKRYSSRRHYRRHSRVVLWQPHLRSISED